MSTQSHRLMITELASCEGCAVLRVSGELDQSGEELFLGTLGACVDAGHPYLVLDVTALSFCDSRGLYCLLAMRWLLDRRGGKLLLAGAGRRLTELLAQTGSVDLLPAQRSVGQALLSLPPSHRPVWPPVTSPGALDDGPPVTSPGALDDGPPRPPHPRPPSP